MGRTKPNWGAVALIWTAVIGIVLWSVYSTKRAEAQQLMQLNSSLLNQISLSNEGVKLDGPDGAMAFSPGGVSKVGEKNSE